jgi:hypothetical protein
MFVKNSEFRIVTSQKLPGLTKLDQMSIIKDCDHVEIEDGVELMCDGEDCPVGEPRTQHPVDDGASMFIETVRLYC